MLIHLRTARLLAVVSVGLGAAERAAVDGQVLNDTGEPVDRATVIVYSAGVKTGYSTYCPTCYPDCGKRTVTSGKGNFRIEGLNTDLLFRLVVVGDGFAPSFIEKVDPAKGITLNAVLKLRGNVEDPARVVRGRLTTTGGTPVRDAVIEPQGVFVRQADGQLRRTFGSPTGLERVAVSNEKGEFEVAHSQPAESMVLRIEGRGLAPKKLIGVSTGAARQTIVLHDGAMVRGRLVKDGKPVPGAEMGLYSTNHVNGRGYDEIRVGTGTDGAFAITNVPFDENWYLYGKMESLVGRGAVTPMKIAVKKDLEDVDVGDIPVGSGYTMRGTVVLTDGNPIPAGMRVIVSPGCGDCGEEIPVIDMPGGQKFSVRSYVLQDTQTVILTPDGNFVFSGLAKGAYQVTAAVRGYGLTSGYSQIRPTGPGAPSEESWKRLSEMNGRLMQSANMIELMVERDLAGVVVKLDRK